VASLTAFAAVLAAMNLAGSPPSPRSADAAQTPAGVAPGPASVADAVRPVVGDAVRGRKLFADANGLNCIGCHRVGGEGGDVGPDLSAVAGRLDRAKLLESVVSPSKEIAPEYRQVIVRLEDETVIAGLVRGETPTELTLVDANGRKTVVRKDEIADRKVSPLSLMPEGFGARLTKPETEDLLAYLCGLRAPARTRE
jgi:putative heme-binding domain-containing protein